MMPNKLPADQIDGLIEMVRAKIRIVLGPSRPSGDLVSDLVSDVFVEIMRKLPQFDPRRATLRTFVARITESALVDRLRRLTADKRNPLRHPDRRRDEDRPLGEAAGNCTSADRRDLVIDLREQLSALPADLQELADELRQSWSVQEIADRKGLHRGTVYRKVRRLRQVWEDSSLRDYLDPD